VGLTGGYWWAYEGLQLGPLKLAASPSPQTFWIAASAALGVVAAAFVLMLRSAVQRSLHSPAPLPIKLP